MSFESSGFPETVCAPDTTQSLEPMGSTWFRNSGGSRGDWFQFADGNLACDEESEVTAAGEDSFSSAGVRSIGGAGFVGGRSRQGVLLERAAGQLGPSVA